MLISPEVVLNRMNDFSLEELKKERKRSLKILEKIETETNFSDLYCRCPDAFSEYGVNLAIHIGICNLIQEKQFETWTKLKENLNER